jgi:hypothetical protein
VNSGMNHYMDAVIDTSVFKGMNKLMAERMNI